jgi:hypothetical protein
MPGTVIEMDIATLAFKLWSVHPREVQDAGISRVQFYEREIRAVVNDLLGPMASIAERILAEVPPDAPDTLGVTVFVDCEGCKHVVSLNYLRMLVTSCPQP